jgi:hypothetical protein
MRLRFVGISQFQPPCTQRPESAAQRCQSFPAQCDRCHARFAWPPSSPSSPSPTTSSKPSASISTKLSAPSSLSSSSTAPSSTSPQRRLAVGHHAHLTNPRAHPTLRRPPPHPWHRHHARTRQHPLHGFHGLCRHGGVANDPPRSPRHTHRRRQEVRRRLGENGRRQRPVAGRQSLSHRQPALLRTPVRVIPPTDTASTCRCG